MDYVTLNNGVKMPQLGYLSDTHGRNRELRAYCN